MKLDKNLILIYNLIDIRVYKLRVEANLIGYQLFFSQYIYFVVTQPNTYMSEICYKFILGYMLFSPFIAIYFYCDQQNRALRESYMCLSLRGCLACQ